jgi:pyruvate/2-oxoglutarate/acetoin dehydrogenase E1 component
MCLLFSWSNCFSWTIRSNSLSSIENWFANTPGLKVIVPSMFMMLKGFEIAIRDNDPVILWNQNKCMVTKEKFQMANIHSNRCC